MNEPEFRSKPLKIDPAATSQEPTLPAFVSKPHGAPPYYGFPLIPETEEYGWCYGAISEFEDPGGCEYGDGFVVAPDGTRAGLVWEVGEGETSEILPPDEQRWGVYAVWFSRPVRSIEDLIFNFEEILPDLKRIYERLHG